MGASRGLNDPSLLLCISLSTCHSKNLEPPCQGPPRVAGAAGVAGVVALALCVLKKNNGGTDIFVYLFNQNKKYLDGETEVRKITIFRV